MNGDQRTGVSIMRVEPKLDSGPVLLQRPLAIGQNQTAGELHDELAALGGVLLVEALGRLFEGSLAEQPQDDRRMTYAHKLSKADGELNFNQTAMQVHNQARGVTPWPGAQLVFTRLKPDSAGHDAKDASPAQSTTQLSAQVQVIVEKGLALEGAPANSLCPVDIVPPGTVLPLQGDILPVVCAEGVYGILRLRPAGGKSMSAASFVNGYLKNCTVCISPV
jgi:methionyl-tRNA formyltransferase